MNKVTRTSLKVCTFLFPIPISLTCNHCICKYIPRRSKNSHFLGLCMHQLSEVTAFAVCARGMYPDANNII